MRGPMTASDSGENSEDDSITSFENQIRDVQRQVVSEMLTVPPMDMDTFLAIFEHSQDLAETLISNNREQTPPPHPIHCCEGCTWCCYTRHIMVTPMEVLVLAKHIRDTFDADQQASYLQSMIEDASSRGGSACPCPMLKDGGCSVYPARPFMCRAHNSFDVTLCQRAVEEDENIKVPLYHPQKAIFNQIQAGLALGFADHGYPIEKLTLRRAIRIALEDENALERWLAGEPIFMDAAIA